MTSFKRWKPHLWDGVIADYDLLVSEDLDGDDSDGDEPTRTLPSSSSTLPSTSSTLPSTSSTLPSTSPIPPPPFGDDSQEVMRKLNEIDSKIDNMKFDETNRLKEQVRNILTCTLCLETVKQSLAFCVKCGTFIGCHECANNIQPDDDGEIKCPLCRAKFVTSCDMCDATQPLPIVAAKIPGLLEWLL